MAVHQNSLNWLTKCPASDLNFKLNVISANQETIQAAIDQLEGTPSSKTAVSILKRQLKKLVEKEGPQMAGKKKADVDTETALAVMQEERNMELQKQSQQAEREQLIAQSHEMIGRIQGVEMIAKMATVSTLIWLRDVKAAKIYRDLPNIGTWDDFCKYLKKDRRTVDEDLQNLAAFGEDFLETVASLQVGYRDLRKLRQLTHDGTVTIDADAVVIGEDRIPLDQDHREDLQAAIEKIIGEQAQVKEELSAQKKAHDRVQSANHKEMVKLQKTVDKLEKKAKAKELSPEEDAILGKIKELGVSLNGYCLTVENVRDALFENPFPNAIAAFVTLTDNIKMRISGFREAAAELAPAGMIEDDWVPPPLRVQSGLPSLCLGCKEDRSHEKGGCDDGCCKTCTEPCSEQMHCRIDA